MASPQTVPQQLPVEQVQAQLSNGDSKGNGHVEAGQEESGVAAVEQGLKELEVKEGETSLHAACAEGRVDDVREILSRGVDNLEMLGCTPIVFAIRNNHQDVVRELLQAGAIVPPPGVTNDQQMLSILYPPHMYGMPPFMHQQHQPQHPHQQQQQQQHMSEYYPQPPFYPSGPNGNVNGGYMPYAPPQQFRQRKESDAAQGPRMDSAGQANLPPADVAKTIPCRNFPNCKYGANCIFFHPRTNGGAGGGGYYGQPQPGYGYDGGHHGFAQQGMSFPQPGYQQYQPQHLAPHPEQNGASDVPSNETSESVPGPESQQQQQQQFQPGQPQPQPIPTPHHMNGMPQPFIPAFQAQHGQHAQMPMSPPDFGGSPISPSMLGNSLPSIPPAEQFFAAASPPPAGFMGMMQPPFAPMPMIAQGQAPLQQNRRQSFNQFALPVNGAVAGGVPIPGGGGKMNGFGHGKKSSFSGGVRPPFAGGARGMGPDYNKWKDGMPPACIFFMQNKCRNGEMCKFPHLDAEGTDLRNPDVIKGTIPPNPSLSASRPPRAARPFESNFKQQQFLYFQQQRAAMQLKNGQAGAGPVQSGEDLSTSQTLEVTTEVAEPTAPSTPVDKGASSLPPKPVTASSLAPTTPAGLVRSASQPGIQRVHVNGFNSRSQSPAPSNVSFHGGGHPKRNNSRPGFAPLNGAATGHQGMNGQVNGNGPRSASVSAEGAQASAKRSNQRVPGADDFPALGGMTGGESKQTSPVARGRTAAEVLSAPAPEKPVVKAIPATENSEESTKSADAQSIEMDSDNESDGVVVISVKPSTTSSTAPTPPTTSSKLPTMSFARMAGGVSSPAESAPIAVKA